jgi:GAF domain-containing protein
MSDPNTSQRTFWELLVGPHPAIQGPIEQRRVRITAIIGLILLVTATVPSIIRLTTRGDTIGMMAIPFLSVYLLAYILSRSPWGVWAPRVLVIGTALIDFGVLMLVSDPAIISAMITFVLLPILFATVLLPAWQMMVLAVLMNLGLGLYLGFSGRVVFQDVVVPFTSTLLVSILSGVTAFLRERDVTTIRAQQERLDDYSQNLEEQIDQRTRNILATAEIGRVIAGTRDLDLMLRQVTSLLTERFNFYYAQIFLVDEAGKNASLRAGTGIAGEELMSKGHRLPVGSQSVVGQVSLTGTPIVVVDTDTDPIHRRNELLPHTRSEVALPLRASGRVTGVLNIQSTTVNSFQPTDVTIFQTVADQLAVAIENARLFERAQRDLADIETLNRQLTGEAWRKFLSGRSTALATGYAGSSSGVEALKGPIEDKEGPGTVSMPLMVRGETIGMLDIMPRSGQEPDEQMKAMLEAVAERVALALDSTRVGEQAQRQAERELILSTISAELQASTDLNVILQTVARETSRAMGAPHSFIHLAMNFGDEPPPAEMPRTERKKAK